MTLVYFWFILVYFWDHQLSIFADFLIDRMGPPLPGAPMLVHGSARSCNIVI